MAAKPSFLFFVATLLTVSLLSFYARPVVAADYTDVTVSEATVMINTRSPVILDVRNQSEYDAGHVRNARLIPLWELATRLSELNKTDEILVYSDIGERSINASRILAGNGFQHVYNMLDGLTEWVSEGFAVYIKHSSVQEAIDEATPGDVIRVSAGLYLEELTVDKPLVLEGENRHTTIIEAAGNSTVYVNADNVFVTDFTLRYRGGCACFDLSTVYMVNSHNASVSNNVIESDDHGIRVTDAEGLTIASNSITCPNNTFIVVLNSSHISLIENSIITTDGMELDNCVESLFQANVILSVRGAGVFAYQSAHNTFLGNEIVAEALPAISISNCYNNTFLGNNVSSNGQYGLFFWESNDNLFLHNNFLGNGGELSTYRNSSAVWDNGFEGNYWSSYTGADADLNGIGDTPQVLDSTNQDNFPLKGLFHGFDTALDCRVDVVSDSAISELEYVEPDRIIRLRVSNTTASQSVGFCRMGIPHSLIDPFNGSISVIIDDGLTPVLFLNNAVSDNGTHRWIYFTYTHSMHEILVVAEFPTFIIPVLLMVATVAAVFIYRRRNNVI